MSFNISTWLFRAVKLIFLLFLILIFQNNHICAQPWCHDPSTIVRNNGRYWVYSTGNGIVVHSSVNDHFKTWRSEPSVFPAGTFPAWIKSYVPDFAGHFWAPDIFFMNGKWHLYYSCSSWGSRNSAIGLATTTSLSNPVWVDQGMVTFTSSSSNHNAIDPAIYRDYQGKIRMLYGSYWNGLVVTELDSLTGKPFDRNNIVFVANNNCEAGSVTMHNGYYYLFFNRGSCCSGVNSTYHIFVGRSSSPTGPFLDKNGVNCNNNGGSSFLRSDGRFVGPGHFSRTDSLFSYHFYDAHNNGASKMNTAKLRWKDGWPVAEYVSEGIIKDGVYTMRNRHSLKLIGLSGAGTSDGTSVVLGPDDGSSAKMWRFTYTAEKYYRISPYLSPSKLLEIRNCGTANGDKAIIWTDVGSPCQEWYISLMSDGYYRIANKNSNLMLEIVNADSNDGALAQQWPFNEHPTQQWKMTEIVTSKINLMYYDPEFRIYADMKNQTLNIQSNYADGDYRLFVYSSSGILLVQQVLTGEENAVKLKGSFSGNLLFLVKVIDSNGEVVHTQKVVF